MRRAIVPLDELRRLLDGDPDAAAPSSYRSARRAARGNARERTRRTTRGRRRSVAARDLEAVAAGAVQPHPRGELDTWGDHLEAIRHAAELSLERPEGVGLVEWSRGIVLNLRTIRRSAARLLELLEYEAAQR